MRVVLAALNAKFIHSSLALACLSQACHNHHRLVTVREYTINENLDKILADLYSFQPDILCFSCYIWNIEMILRLSTDFKKIVPHCQIILGGPEVSYCSSQMLRDCPDVDVVVEGEGEAVMPELLACLEMGQGLDEIAGIAFRTGSMVKVNSPRQSPVDLNQLDRPAYEDLPDLRGRILYYEASRGCPFNCSFCLSSAFRGVRYRSLDRVKSDLKYLIKQGAREIKFVDRTFNADEIRAQEIMEFILQQDGEGRYHFEIRAEFISDAFIGFLSQVPSGRFNFEIGVQSTYPEALRAVKRPTDWQKVQANITRLRLETKIHLHLDLIAGLPFENYQRFGMSFNEVLALQPHILQLGFLKKLKGTSLGNWESEYGYVFQEHPPYQILASDFITYRELTRLKHVEELLERFYNSGAFVRILSYISSRVYPGDPFAFFLAFASYWEEQRLFERAHRPEKGYAYIRDFLALFRPEHEERARQIIKADYLENQGPQRLANDLPDQVSVSNSETLYAWLKDEDFVMTHLPELQELKPGERRRRVHLEYLAVDPQTLYDCSPMRPVLFVYPPGSRQARKIVCLD
ncbi:MAG TPA: radical SAM protein [Syntrophomonadaceae bacterium]|nr:radical SAM protein [Syntrophomonadaceae bacterium]